MEVREREEAFSAAVSAAFEDATKRMNGAASTLTVGHVPTTTAGNITVADTPPVLYSPPLPPPAGGLGSRASYIRSIVAGTQ